MRDKGSRYEGIAADWLQQRGLRLLSRNYHCPRGEIDLIMEDGNCICFIEVKYRASSAFGGAAHAIPASKRQKLQLAAEHYLSTHPKYRQRPQRIDALLLQQRGQELEIDWIRNAIDGGGF